MADQELPRLNLDSPGIMSCLDRAAASAAIVSHDAGPEAELAKDLSDLQIFEAVKPFTMTSRDRVLCLIQAVDHLLRQSIPGDFVECGVWRGGSIMAAARALVRAQKTDRLLYLYDTFEGMSAPTALDVSPEGKLAAAHLSENPKDKNNHYWAYAPLDDVKINLGSTGYPQQNVRLIKGKVEDTIPGVTPDRIALLRLDTDWYESTKHELIHLYPRLVSGGILVLDDYGFWKGARTAVDEYFASLNPMPRLRPIDETGRYCVKA